MRLSVVGHVEWADLVVLGALPAPGAILHAREAREAAGGGGTMAAVALHALGGACRFFCAVGSGPRGDAARDDLAARGLEVHAAARSSPQRRVVTFLTDDGERTITVIGERQGPRGDDPLPWSTLAGDDAVYVTMADAAALRAARRARVVVATPRAGDVLRTAGVRLDALVHSAADPGEVVDAELAAVAGIVVATEGASGGRWRAADGREGRWDAAPLPGPVADAYGCGDAFAAALAFGLADGRGIAGACALAARVGASVLCTPAPGVGDLAALRD